MNEIQTIFVPTLVLAQDGKPAVIGGSSETAAPTGEMTASEGADGAPTGAARPASPFGSNMLIIGMMVFLGFMIITSMMQGRKEKRRKQELLGSLARHDRVQTVGGIIGTVAELADDEVVLRVDDSTNSRVRVTRASIQQILKKGRGSTAEAEAKPPQVEAVS